MPDFKLTVAPNGARRQKSDHPAIPISIAETAATAAKCQSAGADEIHLHIRDEAGRHSLDAGRYRDAIAAVNDAAPGLGIQVTTESAGIYGVADQYACLKALRPKAASIAIREMATDPGLAARVYALADEAGTTVQHILYGPPCLAQLEDWYRAGLVPDHMCDVILVLGKYAPPVLATPDDLGLFPTIISGDRFRWTVCAFGQHESACLLEAVKMGGDVRIGFENNIHRADGSLADDNESQIREFVSAVRQDRT